MSRWKMIKEIVSDGIYILKNHRKYSDLEVAKAKRMKAEQNLAMLKQKVEEERVDLKFEKETGYGTDGEILNKKPPLQQELPFDPKTRPEQKEFDFEEDLDEAEYQGRKVKLNKPMQGDVKKFKVYVKDPKTGNVKKVNFGHGGSSAKGKTMKIRKSNPKARKSFRARHNCDNPGPKTKARYWSCRKW